MQSSKDVSRRTFVKGTVAVAAAGAVFSEGSLALAEETDTQDAAQSIEGTEVAAQDVVTLASAEAVDFLYMDAAALELGDTQSFVVALSDASGIVDASIAITNIDTAEQQTYFYIDSTDSSFLFSFDTESVATFQLSTLSLTMEDGSTTLVDFSDCDDACRTFSVTSAADAEPIDETAPASDYIETEVYSQDTEESVVEHDSVEVGLLAANEAEGIDIDAVADEAASDEDSDTASATGVSVAKNASGALVIALDPGHGGSDSGAIGVGSNYEKTCTWKIAQACKSELSTYKNVQVVLTRSENECPSLEQRVKNAVAQGADVVVSIHINAGGGRGAEVWVPYDTSYNNSTHAVGEELGNRILTELAKLGLYNRGVKTRIDRGSGDPDSDESKYGYDTDGDGKVDTDGDYYGIIRYARKSGIPGIIIEHAFIDNASDYNSFLSSDTKLAELGIADAQGIANAYGLEVDSGDDSTKPLYRLYNPYSGEHFYTSSANERRELSKIGWVYEGLAWKLPLTSSSPVYRLYNPYSSDHHYTLSLNEYNELAKIGWKQEGTAWYSDDAQGVAVYRLFNPNASVGTHHYTTDYNEYATLGTIGWKQEGICWYGSNGSSDSAASGTAIMSTANVGAARMAEVYNATVGASTYPSDVYTQYGAATITDFCNILVEESLAEGVSPNVIFAQAMVETGWLKFGGDVKAEQCNFAGLGATGGVPGNSFNIYGTDSVRMGLRAQVQHLKGYASTADLNNECVDVRFQYLATKRGSCTYVEELGNGNWASSSTYSESILSIMNRL